MKNNFKAALPILLALVIIFISTAVSAANITESPDIKIIVNDEQILFTDVPIIINGRTLLPLRALLNSLGVPNDDDHIMWNGSDTSVTVHKDSVKLFLKVGDNKAKVNDTTSILEVAPVNYKDRVYIPARFIAQNLGKSVDWDAENQTVIISNNVNQKTVDITVDTPEALVNAIGSNRRILLKEGVYNLSDIKHTDSTDGYVKWLKVYDGDELNIQNVSNLTIEGPENGKAEIRVNPRYANIMYFINASNVKIKNIKTGHTPMEYGCDAGVLSFKNSSDISLINSELYGCGSIGLNLLNSKRVTCSSLLIDHCSFRALQIEGSQAVKFSDSKIADHEAYADIIYISKSTDVAFLNCEISNNNKFEWDLIEAYGGSDVLFDNCRIQNNSKNLKNANVYLFKTLNPQIGNGKITVRDSDIKNNSCDYFVDDLDTITFENCIISNNDWVYSK